MSNLHAIREKLLALQSQIHQAEAQLTSLKEQEKALSVDIAAEMQEISILLKLKSTAVFPRASSDDSSPRKSNDKNPPKYKNPNPTGKDWSGFGKAPEWIKGKNYADFLIASEHTSIPATIISIPSAA